MVDNFRMLFIWLFILLSYLKNSTSMDSLSPSQSIRDGETLVSDEETFEVGFFSPGTSTRRYLGIWYRNVSPLTVVWVANRENALQNKLGVMKLDENGVIVILSGNNSKIWWSSSTSSKVVKNPIAQLLDYGNLVVRDERDINEDKFLWQSFDNPCDKFLPGMKIGWNLVTGLDRIISSWKNEDDPAKGEYSFKLDLKGYPQLFGYKGNVIRFRVGSWNGQALVGYPIRPVTQYVHELVFNEKEVYYEYKILDRSIFFIVTLNSSGIGNVLLWTNQTRRIKVISLRSDLCENYAMCGINSTCSMDGNSQTCDCIKGYVPKFPEQWNVSKWYNGCVPRNKPDCTNINIDGLLRYTDLKLPDTSSSWFNTTMSLEECKKSCLKNFSCKAYANLDIRNGGSGCLLWFDDLIDTRKFSIGGQDIYFRIQASSLLVLVNLTMLFSTFLLSSSLLLTSNLSGAAKIIYRNHFKRKLRKEGIGLSTFDFPIIARATENIAESNKLGEGGFGPVYKGRLKDGLEFAVKKLSKNSAQGLEELKNEVVLIAKLQHRNLVKLIGCCIEGNERMLIYEYMPNKSLDCFIFDETRRHLVDWPIRFNIICGIARGLLYLHQDSRLRIVHRDLKTCNILLDASLDPKISDFGLAQTLCGDQVEANTNKVAGTYGYMPPVYVTRGHFSMKSDVFSYGVVVLEIVSGKRNREFSDPKHFLNLVGHAWRLWTEERALELLDGVLRERFTPSEVIRCIQVGLLCVQQRPKDRPDMSSVVLMLNGEKLLPNPKVPGFYTEGDVTPESDIKLKNYFSSNQISITMLEAR
ncbi:G-type lectin S-receptor-like serine/threonine-protein kinase [Glycine soja]|uniref:Receptor-like serine/threonine-protein kinase n=1 Tax=Glycine soja TaxID=3848 RepID=A0A445HPZ2_GLYSO|nr:G-type lectin S-receptor-like serine/threonine-protein kinase [Glycine soja]